MVPNSGNEQRERLGISEQETPPGHVRPSGLPFPSVGLGRLELPTSRLSGVRSNHLSYRPHNDLPIRCAMFCA